MSFLKQLFGGAENPVATNRNSEIDAQSLAAKLKEASAPYLLDVREPYEYADAHIAGAVLIPLGDLPYRIQELPRDREIVCVCRSGNRSGAATRHLVGAGCNAVNLNGGMIGWIRADLPVQRRTGR